LIERAHDAVADDLVEGTVIAAELTNDTPEIMRRGFGFWRDQVEHLALKRLVLVDGPSRHRAVLDHVETRRCERVGVPAIDAAGEPGGALVKRRRLDVAHVEMHAHG